MKLTLGRKKALCSAALWPSVLATWQLLGLGNPRRRGPCTATVCDRQACVVFCRVPRECQPTLLLAGQRSKQCSGCRGHGGGRSARCLCTSVQLAVFADGVCAAGSAIEIFGEYRGLRRLCGVGEARHEEQRVSGAARAVTQPKCAPTQSGGRSCWRRGGQQGRRGRGSGYGRRCGAEARRCVPPAGVGVAWQGAAGERAGGGTGGARGRAALLPAAAAGQVRLWGPAAGAGCGRACEGCVCGSRMVCCTAVHHALGNHFPAAVTLAARGAALHV